MLTRVLVPLDRSSLAQTALDFAERVVNTQCEFVLLTAVLESDLPVYNPNQKLNPEYDVVSNEFEIAKRYLAELAEGLRADGYHVTICVEVGEAAQVITRVANSMNVDMIIMSTHGRSGIDRLVHGSVTGQVLGSASQPVLVVGNQKHQRESHYEKAAMNLVWAI